MDLGVVRGVVVAVNHDLIVELAGLDIERQVDDTVLVVAVDGGNLHDVLAGSADIRLDGIAGRLAVGPAGEVLDSVIGVIGGDGEGLARLGPADHLYTVRSDMETGSPKASVAEVRMNWSPASAV